MRIDETIKIAASILSADFSRLGEQVAEASDGGADYIHVDVMDGHFVPPITMGPLIVQSIRRWTDMPLDVHMMVSHPQFFISDLATAGADIITVHAEADVHLESVVSQIKDVGLKAGVAISPASPASIVSEVLSTLDLVLVMTVNPGYGGQKFMDGMVEKICQVRTMLDEAGVVADLEVDGGINFRTAKTVVDAGARVLVAGSAVYSNEATVAESIAQIRKYATDRK